MYCDHISVLSLFSIGSTLKEYVSLGADSVVKEKVPFGRALFSRKANRK